MKHVSALLAGELYSQVTFLHYVNFLFFFWNLCSTICCFHCRTLTVFIAAPSISGQKLFKNICGFISVWNVSCETDPESVMKDNWLLYFVSCTSVTSSIIASLHTFQNKSPYFCCCMIASEGNVFCFCPFEPMSTEMEETHFLVQSKLRKCLITIHS